MDGALVVAGIVIASLVVTFWPSRKSKCCHAETEYRIGYSFKEDGNYCTACDEMVRG